MAHPTFSVTAIEQLGGHRVRLGFDDGVTVTVTWSRCCGDRFSTRSATTRQSSPR
jgi:hypothetical protein